MYAEQTSLNNQAMTLVADTTSTESNLAITQSSGLIKTTLQLGSTGQAVKELEQLLFHWGYYYGLIDGIFGIQVQNAVKSYQHRVFLLEDGVVGSTTWQALYSGAPVNMPILMNGSSGNVVKVLQNVLKLNGYYFGFVDGFFGAMTKVAVIQFQTNKGLSADGIVGFKSWHALSKLPH